MKHLLKWTLCSSLALSVITLQASEKREVNHYIEANISTNYIFKHGDKLSDKRSFAPGFNVAHGTNITPMHALVLFYGRDYLTSGDATLTSKALFLRRYIPKLSTPALSGYATLGSGAYTYKENNIVLENAGIIVGFGVDYHQSPSLRLSLEADYRGFTVKPFGENTDYNIRPFTLFLGFKYTYSTSFY